jgi:hypothetical protein
MRRLWTIEGLGLAFCAVTIMARGNGGDDVCHVGVQMHLVAQGTPTRAQGFRASDESYLRHLRAFVEQDMADYVLLCVPRWNDDTIDDVARYLAEHRVYFLLQEPYPPSPARRYDADDYARLRTIAGDRFLGVHWGELDSSGLKPEETLPENVYAAPTRRGVKEALLDKVRRICEDHYHAAGVPFAHSSATLSHALFAEAGVDILCSEVGENAPNVSMMIASNRGVARAYGRPWMIDHSTWWSPRGNAGELVSPREGHTPWFMFTSLLLAAIGGADYVQLEVDWAAYDRASLVTGTDARKPCARVDEPGALLPWGRALKTLYSVTRAIGPRGNTVTPFGILMGHESGWPGVGWRVGDVRGTGLFDGIRHKFMQTGDADLSLKVLDVFYPGFERCGWDPEYPGFLSESPLGVCDLVPDNLPADRYTRYRVLVALGYHRMTESLRDALRTYVERGGTLICGDTLFLDEAEKPLDGAFAEPLIGCVIDANPENLIQLYQPTGTLDAIPGCADALTRDEWQNHWLRPVHLTTGHVSARKQARARLPRRPSARVVGRLNDVPYLIENPVGRGRVFFVTALNMVGSSAEKRGQEPFLYANTLYAFLHALEEHVGDGIAFVPWTSIEHVYNERGDGSALLLVMNHGDMTCRRDATMRNPRGYTKGRVLAEGTWEGWRSGAPLQFTQAGDTDARKGGAEALRAPACAHVLGWSFDMPPKSFVVFEFQKDGP